MELILLVCEVIFVEGGLPMVETGVKGYQSTRGVVIGGGYGTYVTVIPNKILVKGLSVTGKEYGINVLYQLRKALGLSRLHEKKRKILLSKNPETLTFQKSGAYWDLTEESAEEWISLVGLKPKIPISQR